MNAPRRIQLADDFTVAPARSQLPKPRPGFTFILCSHTTRMIS
jgi:hypothetical protein